MLIDHISEVYCDILERGFFSSDVILRCRYASKCIFLPFLFFSTHLIENLSYISKMQSVFRRKTPMLVKIAIFFGYLKQFRPYKKKQK